MPWEQLYTLSHLYSSLNNGGLYICENTHLANNLDKLSKNNNSIIEDMVKKDIRPYYITNENYIYIKNNISEIYNLDNKKKCIRCKKCSNIGDICKCEYKNEKMVTIIQKK